MKKMITSVGDYYLEQAVSEAKGLNEFSELEYNAFALSGAPKILKDEKMFYGNNIILNGIRWESILGSTENKIYKIVLQIFNNESGEINSIFKSTLKYLIDQMGKYNKHPFFSKKYYWDKKDGNVIYELKSMGDNNSLNLFLTSNFIADQMKENISNR